MSKSVYQAALGHNWCSWYDGGDGWSYRRCSRCGLTEKKDDIKPVISYIRVSSSTWQRNDVTISFAAQDRGSGISYISVDEVNNQTGKTVNVAKYNYNNSTGWVYDLYVKKDEGSYYYKITVVDAWGNSETGTSDEVKIDKSSPTITRKKNIELEWTNKTQTLYYGANDAYSGVKSVVIKDYAGRQVASGKTTASFKITSKYEGIRAWKIIATDYAGNVSETTVTTKYDITPPKIEGTEITYVYQGVTYSGYCQDNILNQSINDDVSNSSNGTNASSGIKQVTLYKTKGNNKETVYSEAVTSTTYDLYYDVNVTNEYEDYYEVYVTDYAGNVSRKKLTTQRSLLPKFHTSIEK